MAKEFAKKFYNSKQWQNCRTAFILSKDGICERCGAPNSKLVHHKTLLTESNINCPETTLSFDNLELLCSACHNLEHMSKYGVLNDGLSFTKSGDLAISPRFLYGG